MATNPWDGWEWRPVDASGVAAWERVKNSLDGTAALRVRLLPNGVYEVTATYQPKGGEMLGQGCFVTDLQLQHPPLGCTVQELAEQMLERCRHRASLIRETEE